ncbi:hypothetical protein F4782DRAFT_481681 [Xylaria castorea]|nr:hypothetical protein F4782DRAFT_481681 [Xylaria castorea]
MTFLVFFFEFAFVSRLSSSYLFFCRNSSCMNSLSIIEGLLVVFLTRLRPAGRSSSISVFKKRSAAHLNHINFC